MERHQNMPVTDGLNRVERWGEYEKFLEFYPGINIAGLLICVLYVSAKNNISDQPDKFDQMVGIILMGAVISQFGILIKTRTFMQRYFNQIERQMFSDATEMSLLFFLRLISDMFVLAIPITLVITKSPIPAQLSFSLVCLLLSVWCNHMDCLRIWNQTGYIQCRYLNSWNFDCLMWMATFMCFCVTHLPTDGSKVDKDAELAERIGYPLSQIRLIHETFALFTQFVSLTSFIEFCDDWNMGPLDEKRARYIIYKIFQGVGGLLLFFLAYHVLLSPTPDEIRQSTDKEISQFMTWRAFQCIIMSAIISCPPTILELRLARQLPLFSSLISRFVYRKDLSTPTTPTDNVNFNHPKHE